VSAPTGEATRDLADELRLRFHGPLGQELPQLRFMAQKVAQVHGPVHPPAVELGALVRTLADGTEAWLDRESREILPWLSSGEKKQVPVTRQELLDGQDKRKELVSRIRVLTESYQPWEGACGTVARLFAGLQKLDHTLADYAKVEASTVAAHMAG